MKGIDSYSAQRVGVASDTHGLLREEVLEAFSGCGLIIHAGDVGSPSVLERLGGIAKVISVRGNVDRGPWAESLKETECIDICGRKVFIIHRLADITCDPVSSGIDVVVYGHSHRPSISYEQGVLYLNPGSAGPRRFSLPVSVAILRFEQGRFSPEILTIPV